MLLKRYESIGVNKSFPRDIWSTSNDAHQEVVYKKRILITLKHSYTIGLHYQYAPYAVSGIEYTSMILQAIQRVITFEYDA